MELGTPSILLLQKLGKQLSILDLEGQQHPFGGQPPAEIELLQQAGNRFGFFIRPGEHLVVLVQQVSARKMQHREAGLRLRFPVAHHVGVRQGPGGDQLLLSQVFHRRQPVPQAGGQLKFQVFRGGEHLLADLLSDCLVISLQELLGLEHGFPVLSATLSRLAPAGALVHVIVQTGPLLADVPGELLVAAGKLQRQADGLHHVVGDGPAAVGTVIIRPVVRRLADHGDHRVDFLHIQPQIGIALVVLQQDVVFGHIPLDQGAFQHQGLKFTGSHDHVKMVDLAHHDPGLGRMGGRVLKVLADPVFQFFGFADIDHLVGLVPHDIHTGGIGQRQRLFFQFLKGHASSQKMPPQCDSSGIEAVK